MSPKWEKVFKDMATPATPLSKGGIYYPNQIIKPLLPLKKGGREGFLAKPFQMAKPLPNSRFQI
jgi:hypothetical protein